MIKNRLRLIWDVVSTSYWFVPALLFVATLLLVRVLLWADLQGWGSHPLLAHILFDGGVDGARSLLSALSTSMITLTGTVFSLTIVALTLASGQFGPRLLRAFMRSTANQVVLGTFLSTFIYCLLILAFVGGSENGFVPRLAVSTGIGLAVANAALLIFFIHHVARSIHANRVVALAAEEFREVIAVMMPAEDKRRLPVRPEAPWAGDGIPIHGSQRGYVLMIDEDRLLVHAAEEDWQVRLCARAGDFVSEHHAWFEVAGARELEDDDRKQLLSFFDIGSQRTVVQDFEMGILQLVEVAVRSLSPGINDPFTAIVCIDQLGAGMSDLATRRFQERVLHDADGKPRIWRDVTDFAGAMDAAFNQIRQAGGAHMAVLVRLMEVLARIQEVAEEPARCEAIEEHARLVLEAGRENLPQPSDAKLLERYFTLDRPRE